jgi:hypothetical protein
MPHYRVPLVRTLAHAGLDAAQVDFSPVAPQKTGIGKLDGAHLGMGVDSDALVTCAGDMSGSGDTMA